MVIAGDEDETHDRGTRFGGCGMGAGPRSKGRGGEGHPKRIPGEGRGVWHDAGWYCSLRRAAPLGLSPLPLALPLTPLTPRAAAPIGLSPPRRSALGSPTGPPCVTFRRVVAPLWGPWTVTRSSLRMLRWVAAFCRPLRPVLPLVSFPRSRSPVVWCAGDVLNVAGCAVCVSAAPNNWRIGGCAGCCGGRLTVFAVHTPPSTGRPQRASLSFCEAPPASGAQGPKGTGGGGK